jgi:CRISPR-associated protein (TIGR02584 family)
MADHLIGMLARSPQVITEAIWALAFQLAEPVQLASIELIWTEGTNREALGLLGPEGPLARLKRDYGGQMPWPVPRLAREEHTVIDIDDVTTDEEARRAATDIYDHLRRSFARMDASDDQVHVVMAGGRKTMAGLMMTAFQLLGRPGDHLWHVALRVPERELPEGFFYPRPDAPEHLRQTFALHEVPCLMLGEQVAEAGIDLARPFDEILADIQHRLTVSQAPPRLEIDLVDAHVTFKGVELRPDKRRNSLALLALLAWLRRRGEGWLAAGSGLRWSWEHLFQFLRFKQILESKGQVDSLGSLEPRAQIREVAAFARVDAFEPDAVTLPAALVTALEEHAEDCSRWVSAINCAAGSRAYRFLQGETRDGPAGRGRYQRIALPAEALVLRLP